MGKRGPARTPTGLLKMRGSWRADQRVDEPEPERRRPACPNWLMTEAKRVWRLLIPQLAKMGVLGRCDRNLLARYCQTWAKWREAEEWIMQHGDFIAIHDKGGNIIEVKQVPQVNRAIKLSEQLLRFEKECGLTPSARAGLAKPKSNALENRGKGKDRFFQSA